jgi:Phage related hypothetical protein (DUF1799)
MVQAAAGKICEVWPENHLALVLLQKLGTQWLWNGAATLRLGLNYSAVEATARMAQIEMTPDLLARLQLMEVSALSAWVQRAVKGGRHD